VDFAGLRMPSDCVRLPRTTLARYERSGISHGPQVLNRAFNCRAFSLMIIPHQIRTGISWKNWRIWFAMTVVSLILLCYLYCSLLSPRKVESLSKTIRVGMTLKEVQSLCGFPGARVTGIDVQERTGKHTRMWEDDDGVMFVDFDNHDLVLTLRFVKYPKHKESSLSRFFSTKSAPGLVGDNGRRVGRKREEKGRESWHGKDCHAGIGPGPEYAL
jgi:hypothetical protein